MKRSNIEKDKITNTSTRDPSVRGNDHITDYHYNKWYKRSGNEVYVYHNHHHKIREHAQNGGLMPAKRFHIRGVQ